MNNKRLQKQSVLLAAQCAALFLHWWGGLDLAPEHHWKPGLSTPSQPHIPCTPPLLLFPCLHCAVCLRSKHRCVFPAWLCPAASIKRFPVLHFEKSLGPNPQEDERIPSSPQRSPPPACSFPSLTHPRTWGWMPSTPFGAKNPKPPQADALPSLPSMGAAEQPWEGIVS